MDRLSIKDQTLCGYSRNVDLLRDHFQYIWRSNGKHEVLSQIDH